GCKMSLSSCSVPRVFYSTESDTALRSSLGGSIKQRKTPLERLDWRACLEVPRSATQAPSSSGIITQAPGQRHSPVPQQLLRAPVRHTSDTPEVVSVERYR